MATTLDLARHLDGLAAAVARGVDAARRAGLDAAVPPCPRWDVRDLVGHVGMVHRWAAANLRGTADAIGSGAELTEEGRRDPDPPQWWQDGADELIATLREVDDEVDAWVFLRDAPPPRRFWARRQCHEAAIHSVDALAARLGRLPTADEAGIDDDLALDGIDELLAGFLTRGKKLAIDQPKVLGVRPDDAAEAWTISLGPDSPVTLRHPDGLPDGVDETISGSAVELYLALWNRGDQIRGDAATLDWWRNVARVRWS